MLACILAIVLLACAHEAVTQRSECQQASCCTPTPYIELKFTLYLDAPEQSKCNASEHLDRGVRLMAHIKGYGWTPIRFYTRTTNSTAFDGIPLAILTEDSHVMVREQTSHGGNSTYPLHLITNSEPVHIAEYICGDFAKPNTEFHWLQYMSGQVQMDENVWYLDDITLRYWDGYCLRVILQQDFNSTTISDKFTSARGSVQFPNCGLSNSDGNVFFLNGAVNLGLNRTQRQRRRFRTKNLIYMNHSCVQTAYDINECAEGTDNCSQHCINTEGSFKCACFSGYRLNEETTTCDDLPENTSLIAAAVAAAIAAAVVLVVILLLGIILALCARKCKQIREMKLDDHELPRLGFSLEEDKEEVGWERKAQSEVELLPPTPDITAICTATAGADTEAESTVPPSVKQYTETIEVWEGQEINLKLEVVGYPRPKIEWTKQGVRLEVDYATKMHQDGSVTIQSAERSHGGQYHFIVCNAAGKVEGNVRVIVKVEEDEKRAERVISSAIEVERFGEYVSQNHKNNDNGFQLQYQNNLPSGEEGHTTLVGKCSEYKLKNRFKNIIPYDSGRLLLDPIGGCDAEDCQHNYINASYIDGYSQKRKFIASQGPMQRTTTDFWRLIWQEKIQVVVMVTNLTEGHTKKCDQYWPEPDICNYGPFSVTLTEKIVYADFIIRKFRLSVGGTDVKEVTQFHFTSWPDHGVPEYAGPVLSFYRRIKTHSNKTGAPILVHCSAGVGRTGTILAIDIALEQATSEGIIDIPSIIGGLRQQRMKMVQTREQYVFIHDALLEYIMCGDTQIPTPDLKGALHTLQQYDEHKQSTGFGVQFHVLEQVSPKPDEIAASTANMYPERNRSLNFLPPDLWRVALKSEKTNYIHASFANGYKQFKGFIIAQAPMESTCRDFWKMVYDTQCGVIVMLSSLFEEGEEVCHRYWPESTMAQSYKDYVVNVVAESKRGGYTERIFEIKPPKSAVRKVTQFQLSRWSHDGLCKDPVLLMEFIEVVGVAQRRSGNQPLVVHGKDTVSRCGVFCALLNTIECCKAEGFVDVFQMVKALRIQKPGSVCTVAQYTFLFDMMKQFLDSFAIYSNFK